jgi:hypothetical protein
VRFKRAINISVRGINKNAWRALKNCLNSSFKIGG